MLSRKDRISYDNIPTDLSDCPAYITEAGVFGVVLN